MTKIVFETRVFGKFLKFGGVGLTKDSFKMNGFDFADLGRRRGENATMIFDELTTNKEGSQKRWKSEYED
jgi:hypothetical protein